MNRQVDAQNVNAFMMRTDEYSEALWQSFLEAICNCVKGKNCYLFFGDKEGNLIPHLGYCPESGFNKLFSADVEALKLGKQLQERGYLIDRHEAGDLLKGLSWSLFWENKIIAIIYCDAKADQVFLKEQHEKVEKLFIPTGHLLLQYGFYRSEHEKLEAFSQQYYHMEKRASLGFLTAGIAHEIRNPLNFVINFSQLSLELVKDLLQSLQDETAQSKEDVKENLLLMESNLQTVYEQGKRADSIVKRMLTHAKEQTVGIVPTDIHELINEAALLSYHGMRLQDPAFNVKIEKTLDDSVKMVDLSSQEMTRAILNLLNNAYYTLNQKSKKLGAEFQPLLTIKLSPIGKDEIEIRVKDNGEGIPKSVADRLFTPFFTTKPPEHGNGLGLSLCKEIIEQHKGKLSFNTKEGEYTEFIITLPKTQANQGV